jgi:predicted negative regulator of RcsB-dependent stress response
MSRKSKVVPRSYDNMAIENQLVEIRRSLVLIGQNKIDAAMAKLKVLEQSSVPQIKVRSKFLVAELLFRQAEYDLSMQIYEEILTKHAFSGVVLKTLGRLVVCCEKLKLNKKKAQYYSILHDFFEVG